jgi:hypothetical protein
MSARRPAMVVYVMSVLSFMATLSVSRPVAAQAARPAPQPTRRPETRLPPPYLEPKVGVRPFFLVTGQRFLAGETFDAVFGRSVEPFWGGGVNVHFAQGLFLDGTFSHFSAEGERAFTFEGDSFGVGIPLRASVTPIEFSAGWRFPQGRQHQVVPYIGGGIGTYKYTEDSDFASDTENLSAHTTGFLVVGGSEFRVHRIVTTAVDVQYSSVSGILGAGGLSAEFGEDNLGGIAVRFRVMVGK